MWILGLDGGSCLVWWLHWLLLLLRRLNLGLIMSDQDSNDEAEEEASEATILDTTHRQAPESTWVPGQQAKYECTTCTLCSTGSDCPTAGHPFNTELQTGLRCY